jgi:hypothetical protein
VLIGYISEKTRSLPESGGILDQDRNKLRKLEKVLQAFDAVREDENKKIESRNRAANKLAEAQDESQRTSTHSQGTEPG